MLIVQPDFASAEECAQIVAAFDAYQATPDKVLRREDAVTEVQAVRVSSRALSDVRQRMIDHLQFYYAPTDVPEFTLLAELRVGGAHELHADNVKRENGAWVPNHTPRRTHTALVYLSNDFWGGALSHPGLGSLVIPRTGLLVSFPCSGQYEHFVSPVSRGRRMSLALWMAGAGHREEHWG